MKKMIADILYEAKIDTDGYADFMSDEHILEPMKESIRKQFDDGSISFFFVTESERCESCDHWHEVDSCSGIIAGSEEEAIREYRGMTA
jgi:hypothetical protein